MVSLNSKSGFRFMVLAGIIAAAMTIVATRQGIILLAYDSTRYIDTAQNIVLGNGFLNDEIYSFLRNPLTLDPPLYPLVIAMFIYSGVGTVTALILINAISFVVSALCGGVVVCKMTSSGKAGIIASFIVACSYRMVYIHAMALSEPVFLVTVIGAALCLSDYILHEKVSSFYASALCAAAAFYTRYVGVTVVFTAMASLLLLHRQPGKKRFVDSLGYFCIGSIPTGFWMLRNTIITGNPFHKYFSFKLIEAAKIRMLSHGIWGWVFPGNTLPHLTVPIMGVCSILLIIMVFKSKHLQVFEKSVARRGRKFSFGLFQKADSFRHPLFGILFIFIIVYMSFLIVSMLFFDHETPFDIRIMLPVQYCFIIIGISAFTEVYRAAVERNVRIVLVAAAFVFCIGSSATSVRWATKDKSRQKWNLLVGCEKSEIQKNVSRIPPNVKVYSNNPTTLECLFRRQSCPVPWEFSPADKPLDAGDSLVVKNDLVLRRNIFRQELLHNTAVVVWLDSARFSLPDYAENQPFDSIKKGFNLTLVNSSDKGLVQTYEYSAVSCQ